MAKLIILAGPDIGSEFELDPGGGATALTVGRDPRNEIPLNDQAISRRHFRLEPTPRGWRLIDLESRNQTFLNGDPIKEALLADGDLLRLGDTEVRFDNPGAPVEAVQVASTIIKELPARAAKDHTLVERIGSFEQALLEEKARDPKKEARKLLELFGSIAAIHSPQELFERLLREAVPALGADRGVVLYRDGPRWTLRASYPEAATAAPGAAAPIGASLSMVDKAAAERKAILFTNPGVDKDLCDKPSIVGQEIITAIAAPLATQGKGTWVIYADRRGSKPPFTAEDLELLVEVAAPAGALLGRLSAQEELRKENRNLFRSIAQTKKIIGRSRAIEEVLDFIRKAAPTPMTVLIQGETGTGKELVACAIHYASPRRGQPFVPINCAALPENLVESELFGHERGAFTGAVTRRKGRFELADTGTVFLDEVGELSLACQGKLLRLLEEREFERVGGMEAVKVDVRVIAATNRALLELVKSGRFREDLYYRLSVLNLHFPPLRDRPEDILLLAEHFLNETAGGAKKLNPLARKKLESYSWPGNVRQLRNVLESAVVLGEGAEVRPEDLVLPSAAVREEPRAGGEASRQPITMPHEPAGAWEPMSIAELERRHIQRVLEHTGGNKKRAAEILGIERCTLYAKLKSVEA